MNHIIHVFTPGTDSMSSVSINEWFAGAKSGAFGALVTESLYEYII